MLKLIEVPTSTVADKWDVFGWYITQSLPESTQTHDFLAGNILKAILEERLIVLALFDEGTMLGVLSVVPGGDSIGGSNDLLIYSMAGVKTIKTTVYKEALKLLEGFAKRLGVDRIVAQSNLDGIIKLSKSFGFKESTLLIKEL